MVRSKSIARSEIILPVGLLIALSAHAQTETSVSTSTIQSSVVIVVAQGVAPTLGNRGVAAEATGFFTSDEGYIVTAYHLLGDLIAKQRADPSTVTYQVHFIDGTSTNAYRIDDREKFDLLVLLAQVSGKTIPQLRHKNKDNSKIALASTQVYSVGFPKGYSMTVGAGVVTSWGPKELVAPLWSTNMHFKEGQSGSPIFLADNSVVAFAKGDDEDDKEIGLIVPVSVIPENYWGGAAYNYTAANYLKAFSSSGVLPSVVVSALAKPVTPVVRHKPIDVTNAPCAEVLNESIPVSATAGWTIDPQTVKIAPLRSAGASTAHVVGASSSSFDVQVSLANWGKCVAAYGQPIANDSVGSYQGQVSYVETPNKDAPSSPVKLAETVAIPRSTTTILTTAKPEELTFQFKDVSGQLHPFTPTADELRTSNGKITLKLGDVLNRFSQ